MKGSLAFLTSFVIVILCRADLTVDTTGSDLGNLNAVVRSQMEGAKWQYSSTKGKVDMFTIMVAESKQQSEE